MEGGGSARPRRFVPLALNEGVIAQLRIVQVNGSRVSTETGTVLVISLGPTELKFLTNLRLTAEVRWRIWLRFLLEGETQELIGTIRSGREDGEHWWRYDVELDTEDADAQTKLIGALNRRLLRLYPEKLRLHQVYLLQRMMRAGR